MCRSGEITICSHQGQVGYFSPKESLQKATVLDLKKCALQTFPKSGSTVNDLRLVHRDKPLDIDSAPLSSYGIKPQSVVQMVRKVHGG